MDNIINTHIKGISYHPEAERPKVGDIVKLIPEKDNLYDTNAVKVMNTKGEHLGYLPKELVAEEEFHKMFKDINDNNNNMTAIVIDIKNNNENDIQIQIKKKDVSSNDSTIVIEKKESKKTLKRKRNSNNENNNKQNISHANDNNNLEKNEQYDVIYEALKIMTKNKKCTQNHNNDNIGKKNEMKKELSMNILSCNNQDKTNDNYTIQSLIMSKDPTIVAKCIHKDKKNWNRKNKNKSDNDDIGGDICYYFVKRYFFDECTTYKANFATKRWINKFTHFSKNNNDILKKKRNPSRYNQFIKVFITKSKKENPNTPIKIIFRNAANKWTQHYKLLH